MRIQKLNLQNFRSIPRLKLDLQRLNSFIGPHNSGKTNILDGISIFWDPHIRAKVQQSQLKVSLGQQIHAAPPILSYIGESNTIRGKFELAADDNIESWRENDYLRETFARTAILHKQERPYDFFSKFFEKMETLVNLSKISSFKFDMALSQDQLLFIDQKCYLQLNNDEVIPYQSKNLQIIQQAIGSAFIRRFHEESDYDFINENLTRIIKNKDYQAITAIENFLKDVIGQEFIFELGQQEVVVTIEKAYSNPLWRMSTGTLRIIALAYLLIASPLNQIIIIENPGLHLHPKGQRKLARKLERFSEDHQLFFSTHSTRLLIGHAYIVELTKGWTRVTPIKGEKVMRKVVKLLGIRPSDSFGADVVVFVEGRTDARVFQIFENILLNSDHPRVSYNRVSYIGVGGWTNINFVLSIELLRSKFVRSKALAITDGDVAHSEAYQRIRKNWASVFSRDTFFSLREECVESLFLNNPDVFSRVSNDVQNKFLSIEDLQEVITKRRNAGVSDKIITREIIDKYFSRRYTSSVAELLARKFEIHEIPRYLVTFFTEYIL